MLLGCGFCCGFVVVGAGGAPAAWVAAPTSFPFLYRHPRLHSHNPTLQPSSSLNPTLYHHKQRTGQRAHSHGHRPGLPLARWAGQRSDAARQQPHSGTAGHSAHSDRHAAARATRSALPAPGDRAAGGPQGGWAWLVCFGQCALTTSPAIVHIDCMGVWTLHVRVVIQLAEPADNTPPCCLRCLTNLLMLYIRPPSDCCSCAATRVPSLPPPFLVPYTFQTCV